MQESPLKHQQQRKQLTKILEHLDHVLPGQGPILDFVHHNTLHGYQFMPFAEALETAENLSGISGYLPEQDYRRFYQQGRIDDGDLSAAFAFYPGLQAEQLVCELAHLNITRELLYRTALQIDLSALTCSQLQWQLQTALEKLPADLPEAIRLQWQASGNVKTALTNLWASLLNQLDVQAPTLHPETLLDLSLDQAEVWLAECLQPENSASVHLHTQQQAQQQLDDLLTQVGDTLSLRGFVLALSGIDVLDCVRPQLIKICASSLDEGIAAWHHPERHYQGLYTAWRSAVYYDANHFLHQLPDWQTIIDELPEDALDTIILQLSKLDIPETQWEGYLRRIALELPGWSGMINWRQQHPHYHAPHNPITPSLGDYLAIRLSLDRLWLNQICHDLWKVEAKLGALHTYFAKNLSEFLVRHDLYQAILPEYLSQLAEALILQAGSERQNRADWQQLADLIVTWQQSPLRISSQQSAESCGWRLFRLCQYLGLQADQVQVLSKTQLQAIIGVLDEFTLTERQKIWLYAYEHHYRETLFQALRANHQRGRWAPRETTPQAQLIFCMDDREEGFRRHLEEFNPAIETLGAAGFFGIAMDYQGLEDDKPTPLCPIVVTPAHEVHEHISDEQTRTTLFRYRQGRRFNQRMTRLLYQDLRQHLVLAYPVLNAIAPIALLGLIGKSLFPKPLHGFLKRLNQWIAPPVKTQLQFSQAHTPIKQVKPGFSDVEQADRVAGFLRNTGLTYGFAELVVLMGHGSGSQNNPHLAAYDCGACSGRHGGPNARVFAAMANRPEIRQLLDQRGMNIPDNTWFIGAEHNTCSEAISWFDLNEVPQHHEAALIQLQKSLDHAQHMSAHERCRRLASAPRRPTPKQALKHIEERAADFSQARPELGHATNAAAIIGRRAISQGIFMDRRVFLISYDPTQDEDGHVLEGILLAVGPVGAGINLEYYFSTVNNEQYGCGTKVPHNITGLFAVMEGTQSDLRTGLPKQMIEIHEAMRLQLIVEAKPEILEDIYARQASLRELIAGAWVHLTVKDPDSDALFYFNPDFGFEPWSGDSKTVPILPTSVDCYVDQSEPVTPMLVRQV